MYHVPRRPELQSEALGDFYLILRMYQPSEEILNGTYQSLPATPGRNRNSQFSPAYLP
jgi:hypothetical protein